MRNIYSHQVKVHSSWNGSMSLPPYFCMRKYNSKHSQDFAWAHWTGKQTLGMEASCFVHMTALWVLRDGFVFCFSVSHKMKKCVLPQWMFNMMWVTQGHTSKYLSSLENPLCFMHHLFPWFGLTFVRNLNCYHGMMNCCYKNNFSPTLIHVAFPKAGSIQHTKDSLRGSDMPIKNCCFFFNSWDKCFEWLLWELVWWVFWHCENIALVLTRICCKS